MGLSEKKRFFNKQKEPYSLLNQTSITLLLKRKWKTKIQRNIDSQRDMGNVKVMINSKICDSCHLQQLYSNLFYDHKFYINVAVTKIAQQRQKSTGTLRVINPKVPSHPQKVLWRILREFGKSYLSHNFVSYFLQNLVCPISY